MKTTEEHPDRIPAEIRTAKLPNKKFLALHNFHKIMNIMSITACMHACGEPG
jgi:hypothetical protein